MQAILKQPYEVELTFHSRRLQQREKALMESKSELTSQILMISSERERTLCESEELQGEIDLRIKRCDGLQTEKSKSITKDENYCRCS